MKKIKAREIISTSIITAFTIAAALIWKDVIMEAISLMAPLSEGFPYRIAAAIVATIFVIVAIYATIETENEAEIVIKKIKKRR